MADKPMPPSEFGGAVNINGIQPLPHQLTGSEKLRLAYRTGQEVDRDRPPDSGTAFNGLLPEDIQRALRQEAGDLEKGQVWAAMLTDAEAEAAAIEGVELP